MVLEPTITNSYSMDIIIKICGTLTSFVIFIFISAWHLTRKKYKLPQFVQEKYLLKDVKDLTNFTFLDICYRESENKPNYRVLASPGLDNKIVVIINDFNWCFDQKSNFIFTVPFSLTPKSIKQSWKGIIFSHDSVDIDVLRCLMVKGFESIDWSVLNKSIDFGLHLLTDKRINVELSSQMIAFESIMGYTVDADNLEKKLIFISKITKSIEEFSNFYYYGQSMLESESRNPSEFSDSVNRLLEPVVESAIYNSDAEYSNSISTNYVSENILSQLAKLRHHLREENVNCGILTVENFSHVIFEHIFILKKILVDCLRGVELLCTMAPGIIDVIKKELLKETSVDNQKNIRLTEFHLEASTSLVYTKSVAQELMRVLSLGVDFDLSLTERDISLGRFDLTEKSIVVVNHFAFNRDKSFHVKNRNDGEIFRPSRFIKYYSSQQKYVFYNSEKMVAFQDQWHIVGLPRNFICRLLVLLLVKIATSGYHICITNQSEDANLEQYELIYDLDRQFVWEWGSLKID